MATNNAANFGTGTAGQVLTSNGAGVAPTFQAVTGGGLSNYFAAYFSGGSIPSVTGDGTVYTLAFDSTTANNGSVINTGTGTFTAPTTGAYFFGFTIYPSNLVAGTNSFMRVYITTTATTYQPLTVSIPSSVIGLPAALYSSSLIAPMTAGDTCMIQFTAFGGTKVVGLNGGLGQTTFFGFKVS